MEPVPLQILKNGEAEEVKKSNGMPCLVQILKVSEKEVWRNGLCCKTKEVISICLAFWVNCKTDSLG